VGRGFYAPALFLFVTPHVHRPSELRRIPLLETVWKVGTSTLRGSHECSERGQEALIRHLGCHQIHTLQSLLAIFQTVSRRGILGSSYPRSCIAPVLTGQNLRARPPFLDWPALHFVALDKHAAWCISPGPGLWAARVGRVLLVLARG
jgi:hypothetical protein